MGKNQFHFTFSYSNKFTTIIVVVFLSGSSTGITLKNRLNTHSIYRSCRQSCTGNGCNCRQNINCCCQLMRNRTCCNPTGPADNTWHPWPSFPHGPFTFTKRECGSGMITIIEPGSIITGKNDHCIVIQIIVWQCIKNFTYWPVNLHDHISIHSLLAFTFKFFWNTQRNVRHGMRQI